MKRGVQLYVKRVFIMDECKELIPAYLRWVKGVVDAQDLSLNVSREILQKDRQIRAINKQLVKKVFDTLKGLKDDKPDEYQKFWAQFGAAIKEGLVSGEPKDHERILETMLVRTTEHEGLVSLSPRSSRSSAKNAGSHLVHDRSVVRGDSKTRRTSKPSRLGRFPSSC